MWPDALSEASTCKQSACPCSRGQERLWAAGRARGPMVLQMAKLPCNLLRHGLLVEQMCDHVKRQRTRRSCLWGLHPAAQLLAVRSSWHVWPLAVLPSERGRSSYPEP